MQHVTYPPLVPVVVRVLGGRVLRGVCLRPALLEVHQLGLGPQGQEVLPVHVPSLVSHVLSSVMIQFNLEGKVRSTLKVMIRVDNVQIMYVFMIQMNLGGKERSKLKMMIRPIRPNNGSNSSREGIMRRGSHV